MILALFLVVVEAAADPTEDAAARVFPAYPRRWHQRVEGVLSRDALRVMLWRRSSRAIHDLAAGAGVRYYHFLQPNQYVPASKPMGTGEKRDARRPTAPYRRLVEVAYPLLTSRDRARNGVRPGRRRGGSCR